MRCTPKTRETLTSFPDTQSPTYCAIISSHVVFYNIPTREGTPWSLNSWKGKSRTCHRISRRSLKSAACMFLDYKKICYGTEWIGFPDLASELKFSNYSIAPRYCTISTSPTVKHEDGTYTMDSRLIAQELEKLHPSPPFYPDDPLSSKARPRRQIAMPAGPTSYPKNTFAYD
jgi:hypothetical protein